MTNLRKRPPKLLKTWKSYVQNEIYISSITQIIFYHSNWTKASYIWTEKVVVFWLVILSKLFHVFNWLEKTSDKDSFPEAEKNKSKSVDTSIHWSILGSLCGKHLKKLLNAHRNINSLRNIFEFLVDQIKGKVNLLMVSETKLDESFP